MRVGTGGKILNMVQKPGTGYRYRRSEPSAQILTVSLLAPQSLTPRVPLYPSRRSLSPLLGIRNFLTPPPSPSHHHRKTRFRSRTFSESLIELIA